MNADNQKFTSQDFLLAPTINTNPLHIWRKRFNNITDGTWSYKQAWSNRRKDKRARTNFRDIYLHV